MQDTRATRCRELQSKSDSLWEYVGKITVDARLEKVKIIMETWFLESVPKSRSSRKETA